MYGTVSKKQRQRRNQSNSKPFEIWDKKSGVEMTEICANCNHLKEVYKHPQNKGKAKGRISELYGYACGLGSNNNEKLVFFEDNIGSCELFSKKVIK
jgi:hypothetical protein